MAIQPTQFSASAVILLVALQAPFAVGQVPTTVAPLPAAPGQDAAPCVLLRNDHVLFGKAHQVGQFVVVRKGDGDEVRLPRKDVACWAPSVRDLYRYRVDHRLNNDVATMLKDARWCLRFDLHDLAAVEIAAARKLDPRNREAQMIEDQMARARSPRTSQIQVIHPVGSVDPVNYEQQGPDLSGVDLQTLRFFATNVQVTLMNRCGQCHAHDSGRPWSLMVPGPGARSSARMTRENFAATLRFIDSQSPEQSEILQKGLSPHGGSPAPLDVRHAKSIQGLKAWLAAVSQVALPVSGEASPNEWPGETEAALVEPAPAEAAAYLVERPVDLQWSPSPAAVPAASSPARLPQVSDPFSPDLFNRRHHRDQP